MIASNLMTVQKLQLFEKFKDLLYKYYPRFSKVVRLRQFLLLLYDRASNFLSEFLSIEKLLKNNVS